MLSSVLPSSSWILPETIITSTWSSLPTFSRSWWTASFVSASCVGFVLPFCEVPHYFPLFNGIIADSTGAVHNWLVCKCITKLCFWRSLSPKIISVLSPSIIRTSHSSSMPPILRWIVADPLTFTYRPSAASRSPRYRIIIRGSLSWSNVEDVIILVEAPVSTKISIGVLFTSPVTFILPVRLSGSPFTATLGSRNRGSGSLLTASISFKLSRLLVGSCLFSAGMKPSFLNPCRLPARLSLNGFVSVRCVLVRSVPS